MDIGFGRKRTLTIAALEKLVAGFSYGREVVVVQATVSRGEALALADLLADFKREQDP